MVNASLPTAFLTEKAMLVTGDVFGQPGAMRVWKESQSPSVTFVAWGSTQPIDNIVH